MSSSSRTVADKDLQKALETPEEKYKRRLLKKQLKQEKKAKEEALLGYSNESNPFGDTNLSENFVWKKKIEKLQAEGRLDPNWRKQLKRKREELKAEVDEVKQRRDQRDREKALAAEQRAELQRQEEARNALEFEKRGESFAVVQLRQRRDQRLADGRARTVDYLSKNLDLLVIPEDKSLVGYQMEMREPYKLVSLCSVEQLRELRQDVQAFVTFEKQEGTAREYWSAVLLVVEDELLRKQSGAAGDPSACPAGMHPSVSQEVFTMLQEKPPQELEEMEQGMTAKVKAGGSGVDVEYWTAILAHLKLLKAKARLREVHKAILGAFLRRVDAAREAERQRRLELEEGLRKARAEEEDMHSEAESEEDEGGFSPVLEHGGDSGDEYEEVADPRQDEQEQAQKRRELVAAEKLRFAENEKMQLATARSMGLDEKLRSDEALFSDEVDLGKRRVTEQSDRFRPRKPKYFNRVHTAYEWNKYNRTHYDYDNPPPKVVMGYKFNIFYPDLVDPSRQQPTYFVEPTEKGWNDDVCVIRFHAGPPYEDIAFKIVNKKWEYNIRRGFKCTFERGVLHLYFNFQRHFYRR